MNLNGKIALITGGSRGIGKAIALKLASLGANIVVNYTKSDAKAKEVIKLAEEMGVRAIAVKADVSNKDDVENFINKVLDEFGRIDILVNNAGITRDNLLMRMKEEEWDDVININLKGTFNVTKTAIRSMIKQKSGSIINVASVIGITGNQGQCNYAASKAGIIGFTKSIAKEVAKKKVRVNAVAPGFINTDMTDKLPDKVKEEYLTKIPLNRLGEPEDIANAVAFLASDLSSYITGQVLIVDGGLLI
ncbi:3-ketoacyl-ACP reductase [Caloranaerobacter azorensis H53214]|uniref:3-oxoacyl-[acyl-carrier-protein] reductase n=2 Tax=Caloranaerobacter azorensis TaxID=116090 RepID=A0A1M5RPW8_9FIRM|nr:3-oxoacyl-[acyl-carrier-protein] reductase [Caloranaerobacter azorensis]KGG81143.1 3-ketoacyl-ACP reductase [Caloranaerobacter azorensis H53214]SHH28216.1 3-oxoacyl-[acyl-carrier-protein] reductase [Caloranaerobacter azorensis DSM 13643]